MRRSLSLIVIAAAALLGYESRAQEYRYAVFELPDFGGAYQFDAPGGIDAAGNVVGGAGFDPRYFHASFWPHSGGIVDLGTLGGNYAGAACINEVGDIAGWAGFDPNGSILDRRAVVWRRGQIIDLGTLGGETSVAYEMNDAGQVVGESEYEMQSSRPKAYLWENGQMRVLPAPHPDWDGRAAFGINNVGDIVGNGYGVDGVLKALLWQSGQVTELGALSNLDSAAYAINDSGVIVGYSRVSSGEFHATRWVNEELEDIHTLTIGPRSVARAINEVGQIVGDNGNVLDSHAFVLNPGEPMILLDDLVPPFLLRDWIMERTTSINDAGQIPVTASYNDDHWALLLTPVLPTMTLQGPQPGRAGTTNGLRVTGVTPGARVTFLYSRHGGGTRIPGCDLQQNALQLDNPTIIGTAVANQQGVATITRPVPLIARGQTILFQAVVQNECAISQLVVHRFD